ncbi:hypothetical protein ABK040_008700 [Willaertia magna]
MSNSWADSFQTLNRAKTSFRQSRDLALQFIQNNKDASASESEKEEEEEKKRYITLKRKSYQSEDEEDNNEENVEEEQEEQQEKEQLEEEQEQEEDYSYNDDNEYYNNNNYNKNYKNNKEYNKNYNKEEEEEKNYSYDDFYYDEEEQDEQQQYKEEEEYEYKKPQQKHRKKSKHNNNNIWNKTVELEKDVRIGNTWVMSKSTIPIEKASLSDSLVEALKSFQPRPITNLFSVQRAVVPVIISMNKSGIPGDICIGSPTGSGKTLTYLLPIIEVLSNLKYRKVRALILVPNATLVSQVYEQFKAFEGICDLKMLELKSTNDFLTEQLELIDNDEKMKDGLKSNGKSVLEPKVDVLVGEPSRVLEHLKYTKGLTLDYLNFLVLDEVDALVSDPNLKYMKDIMAIYHHSELIKDKRTRTQIAPNIPLPIGYSFARIICCSATLTEYSGKLDFIKLYRPQFFSNIPPVEFNSSKDNKQQALQQIQQKEYTLPDTLFQFLIKINPESKIIGFILLLLNQRFQMIKKKTLIFVQREDTLERLLLFMDTLMEEGAFQSEKGFGIYPEIDSNNPSSFYRGYFKSSKIDVIQDFKNNEFNLLFTTDILGRGFDVDVDYVINFEAPLNLETYVHRVGRTARAGREGIAFTFITDFSNYENYKQILMDSLDSKFIQQYVITHKLINERILAFRYLIDKYKLKFTQKKK